MRIKGRLANRPCRIVIEGGNTRPEETAEPAPARAAAR
jgi:hypothetical protein